MANDDDVLTRGLRALADDLARGALTSVQVTEALLARVDVVQRTVKPYARLMATLARSQAHESDERRSAGQARSPLDGVPLSLEESIDVAGHPTTLGLPSRAGHVADHDAAVAALLRDAGAVFLGKTNVSQALLSVEASNPLFGVTNNPFAPARAAGGTAGGEAAAIACGASPGGVGTDVVVAAHFSGVCGLKPTTDRWSNAGVRTALPGLEIARAQVGPVARTVDDLAFLFEVVTPARCAALDPRCSPAPLPRARDVDVKRLRVGWFVDDRVVSPSPAVERAVTRAAKALGDAGARVEHYTPFLVEDALFTAVGAAWADGAEALRSQLDARDVDTALQDLWRFVRMPDVARRALGTAMELGGDKHVGRLIDVLGERTVVELWQLTKSARDIALETHATWLRLGLDVVLCPPHATPAIPHGGSRDFALAGAAAVFWQLVQFPAGVVPVTTVRDDEAQVRRAHGRLEKRAAAVDAGSAGLPVGVQVVARPFHEHHALAAMAAVEAAVRDDEDVPETPLV